MLAQQTVTTSFSKVFPIVVAVIVVGAPLIGGLFFLVKWRERQHGHA